MDTSLMPLDEVRGLGEVFVKSGFFADSKDASQAIVKIIAGRELGFGPFASMTGVYIVKGRPALGANLIAARIKGSGRYDYRVTVHDGQKCEIEFYERSGLKPELIGVSTFTLEDAKKAGTGNLDRFPRNMLFARAMTNGAKWYCPDIFGLPIYTPDELGAETDEDGNIVKTINPSDEYEMAQPGILPEPERPPEQDQQDKASGNGNGSGAMDKTMRYAKGFPWREWCAELVKAEPYYNDRNAPAGKVNPDYFHIRGAGKKLGFSEITVENANEVKLILIEHACHEREETASAAQNPNAPGA